MLRALRGFARAACACVLCARAHAQQPVEQVSQQALLDRRDLCDVLPCACVCVCACVPMRAAPTRNNGQPTTYRDKCRDKCRRTWNGETSPTAKAAQSPTNLRPRQPNPYLKTSRWRAGLLAGFKRGMWRVAGGRGGRSSVSSASDRQGTSLSQRCCNAAKGRERVLSLRFHGAEHVFCAGGLVCVRTHPYPTIATTGSSSSTFGSAPRQPCQCGSAMARRLGAVTRRSARGRRRPAVERSEVITAASGRGVMRRAGSCVVGHRVMRQRCGEAAVCRGGGGGGGGVAGTVSQSLHSP